MILKKESDRRRSLAFDPEAVIGIRYVIGPQHRTCIAKSASLIPIFRVHSCDKLISSHRLGLGLEGDYSTKTPTHATRRMVCRAIRPEQYISQGACQDMPVYKILQFHQVSQQRFYPPSSKPFSPNIPKMNPAKRRIVFYCRYFPFSKVLERIKCTLFRHNTRLVYHALRYVRSRGWT